MKENNYFDVKIHKLAALGAFLYLLLYFLLFGCAYIFILIRNLFLP